MAGKSNTYPVIMYPEGCVIGKVRSGKNAAGKVRHVAFDIDGDRVGTFNSYQEANEELVKLARKTSA